MTQTGKGRAVSSAWLAGEGGRSRDWELSTDAACRDSQVPITMAEFETAVKHAAWRSRLSWAAIATEDKAFDQAMLVHMAERIGAEISYV